jgi:hypothetical protein
MSTAESHILQIADATSPVGDFLTSPSFGICDPTQCRYKHTLVLTMRPKIRSFSVVKSSSEPI